MNRRHLCLLFFVSWAALLVKSEFTIEVDENGDEYVVKRFYIPGRQRNKERSQCVEIRQKRAIQPQQPQPLYFDNGSNDEIDIKDDDMSDSIKGVNGPTMLLYSQPAAAEEVDEKEEKTDAADATMNEMNKETQNGMTLSYTNVKNNTKSEEIKEENDDNIVEQPQLPILRQPQNAVAAAASFNDEANTAGIVVVQSHKPPKVNPQTHAIFELIPVEQVISEANFGEADVEIATDDLDVDYNEELSPISTTYSSSTDDDGLKDIYDDHDQSSLRAQKLKTGTNQSKKPKRKNKKNNNNSKSGLASGNQNRNKNQARPNKTNAKRPIKTQKLTRNKIIEKPAGNNNRPNRNKNRKNKGSYYYYNRNRRVVNRNKNNKYAEVFPNGNKYFTRWPAWTDDYDYEYGKGYVNCIIIRKDSQASTTKKPFWNFWGRSTNGARQATDRFGKRKRINLRLVA